MHIPFYFAAALSLANAIALYFILPESLRIKVVDHFPRQKNRFVEIIESLGEKEFGVINLVYFLLVTAFSIMTYAFVLYTAYRFGYDPEHNGYLFAYIGVIAIITQGFLFNRLVSKFGEPLLIAVGCLLMVVSLFAVPLVGPQSGGVAALLFGMAVLSIGNSLASPALTSLASKGANESDQGRTMGILQSGASLARVVGPVIGGVLLNNALNGMDDSTLLRTFWTASAIMFIAFLGAVYSLRLNRSINV